MTTLIYRPADAPALRKLLGVLQDPIGAQLDEIAAAFPTATPEAREELIEYAAELLTLDPDSVDGESCVSDEQDARNSRPFPW